MVIPKILIAAADNHYIDTEKPIVVVIREILSTTGVLSIGLRTKCVIKDVRTEKAFQSKFIIDTNRELKHIGIR